MAATETLTPSYLSVPIEVIWGDSPTKPAYTASEVGALPAGTSIPTKTSELDNDSKLITYKTYGG